MAAKSNFIFSGARGSGKSFAALALARRRSAVLIVDPTSSVSNQDYTDTDPERLARVVERYKTFRACFWCGHLRGSEIAEALKPIIKAAEEKDTYVTIILDEVGVIFPNRISLEELERSARMSRHNATSWWFLSQRNVDISTNLRAQCERMFVFATSSARDVENIRREYGREAADSLSTLSKHQYLAIDTQTRQFAVREPIKAPGL